MRKNKNFFLLSLMVGFFAALLISGCGGGGGGGGGSTSTQTTITLSGEVYDDILDGATVSFYLTNPNQPIAQTGTWSDGTYQAQVTVNKGTEKVYTKAEGGKFASTGEEFTGSLYGVAPLKNAVDKSLQVHLNPVTSLLQRYLTKTPGLTLDDALAWLQARLKQIDANTPDVITSADLSQMCGGAPLVHRISDLLAYQVNQEDPNVSSIDRVIDRMAGDWLPKAFRSTSTLRQSLELAEAAMKTNGKGELTGRVVNLNDPNNPVAGAVISVRGTAFQCQTDGNGNFFFSRLPTEIDLIIDVHTAGYASTQAVTKISSVEKIQGIVIKLKAADSRIALDMEGGIVASYNARAKSIAGGGLQLSTLNNAMSLTFPPETLRQISRHMRQSQRYSGEERYSTADPGIIYVKMTSVDPTREIEAFPGDFTTTDPDALGEEGEKRAKKLESVVLGEFSLEYEDGTPVTDIDLGDGVEIRFRLPDNLQDMYLQKYEQGERTIPWYAYDPNTSVWTLSDEPSGLIVVDDIVYAVATATHFSWWNVDWPVTTHGCIEGYVRTKLGAGMPGVQIVASGIDYQGQSYATTDSSGHYLVTVKKDAWTRITARFGEYEVTAVPNSIYVDKAKTEGCTQVDITFHLLDICGHVYNTQNSGTGTVPVNNGIRGAYVYSSTGVGKYTDPNGDFHLVSIPNTSLKLKVSYTQNRINHRVSKDVIIADADLCGSSRINIPINLSPQYVRGTVKIIENNITKTLGGKEVKITADNGFTTANDPNGRYEVVVESGTEKVDISYRYYAKSGTYLEQRRTITWVNIGTDEALVLQMQGNPNVTFEVKPVWLYGTVTDATTGEPIVTGTGSATSSTGTAVGIGSPAATSGNTISNVRISTTLGTSTLADPNTAEYGLSVPSDTTFQAIARLVIPEAKIAEEQRQRITTGLSDAEKVFNFVLDSRVARITGQVKEAVTGTPLPYVTVVSEYKARTTTDANGHFTLIVPAADAAATVRLAFTCDGYNPEFRDFDTPLNRGDISTVPVELEKHNHRPVIRKVDVTPGLRVCLNGVDTPTTTLNITAIDADGDPLTYSVAVAQTAPQGASQPPPAAVQILSDPNHFTWATPQTPGKYVMTVSVSDTNTSGKLTASVRLPIELVDCTGLNKNPVIISITPAKSGVPNETKSFTVSAYDPDGDATDLNYQWHVFAPGTTPGPTTDLISTWSANSTNRNVDLTIPANPFVGLDADQPATFTVRVTVTDDNDGKVEKDTYLTVQINRPPVIKSIKVEPGHCIIGDTVKLFVQAVDPDDPAGTNPLTYTWSYLETNIGSDPNVEWTVPDASQYTGDLDIKLTVRDTDLSHPRSATQSVRLVVGANNAPIIASISPAKTRVLPDEEVTILAAVTDPEGRTLSYEWSCAEGEGTILTGQGTSEITWKAPQTIGDHSISLKVKDGLKETSGNLSIRVATLTVDAGENQAIVLADLVASPISLEALINVSPSGEPHTITWEIDPASIPGGANPSLDQPHNASTKFITNKAGNYHILVTVTMTANNEISEQDDLYVQVYEYEPPSVSGFVKDAQGNPVQAAVEMYDVDDRQAWDRNMITDENGYYEFTEVPPGTYYVIVARDGYLQMTKTVTIPAAE